MILWLVGLAAAACPDDAVDDAVHAAADVESAFVEIDETVFDASRARLTGDLPCIRAALSAPDAAAIHRAYAVSAYYDQHGDDAAKSYAAVRALQPGWQPSETLLPPGHPLRKAWTASATVPSDARPAPFFPPGGWLVDGERETDVPVARAFLLQAVDVDGAVLATRYVWSFDQFPASDAFAFAPASAPPHRARSGRAVGTSLAGAFVLGSAGAALAAHAVRQDVGTAPYDEIAGMAHRSNAFVGLSAGLLVAGGAVGTLAWVVQ